MVYVDFQNQDQINQFVEDELFRYYFHYTDAESALNIICDEFIYPYEYSKYEMTSKDHILFTELDPWEFDVNIIELLHDQYHCYYDSCDIYKYTNKCKCNLLNKYPLGFRNRFDKLHYAFGFKRNLKEFERFDSENNSFILHEGKLDLRDKEFILIYRDFKPSGFYHYRWDFI